MPTPRMLLKGDEGSAEVAGRFNVITVEHNWVQSARDGIRSLLTSHGYTRVLPAFSQYDDWYIRNGLQTL